MVFMLGTVIEEHTFLTKDVLPMRLGDIRIVFTPFSKLDLSLLVSCVLSVKLSPSTDTPNTNVFSINHCFADKCSENCESSQLCGPQNCELFKMDRRLHYPVAAEGLAPALAAVGAHPDAVELVDG